MSTKTSSPPAEAPEGPYVSPQLVAALLSVRPLLDGVPPEKLVSAAFDAAAAQGFTWRLRETREPQILTSQLLSFHFCFDLIGSDGALILGHDVMTVAVQARIDHHLSDNARAVAHYTFVRSTFGLTGFPPYMVQEIPAEPASPVAAPTVTENLEPTPIPEDLFAADEVYDPVPEEPEEPQGQYLIAQSTPDGVPILQDLYELLDASPDASEDEVCADAMAVLSTYAEAATVTGQLAALWKHNEPQAIEFIKDFDTALYESLLDVLNSARARIQEAPVEPKAVRARRGGRRKA